VTREEINTKLKALIACMKCEVSGKPCDDNCPTQYEAGHTGEIIENLEAISKLLEQEPSEDTVSRSDVMALIERTNLKYISSFTRGISQKAFEDLLYGTLSLPSVIPKGVTVTDFADKCRECGREKVLDKIRAEIEAKCCITVGRENEGAITLYDVFEIIDKYKAESEE